MPIAIIVYKCEHCIARFDIIDKCHMHERHYHRTMMNKATMVNESDLRAPDINDHIRLLDNGDELIAGDIGDTSYSMTPPKIASPGKSNSGVKRTNDVRHQLNKSINSGEEWMRAIKARRMPKTQKNSPSMVENQSLLSLFSAPNTDSTLDVAADVFDKESFPRNSSLRKVGKIDENKKPEIIYQTTNKGNYCIVIGHDRFSKANEMSRNVTRWRCRFKSKFGCKCVVYTDMDGHFLNFNEHRHSHPSDPSLLKTFEEQHFSRSNRAASDDRQHQSSRVNGERSAIAPLLSSLLEKGPSDSFAHHELDRLTEDGLVDFDDADSVEHGEINATAGEKNEETFSEIPESSVKTEQ